MYYSPLTSQKLLDQIIAPNYCFCLCRQCGTGTCISKIFLFVILLAPIFISFSAEFLPSVLFNTDGGGATGRAYGLQKSCFSNHRSLSFASSWGPDVTMYYFSINKPVKQKPKVIFAEFSQVI